MGAKTSRPNREPPVVVDVEGGTMSSRDVKVARELSAEVMSDREFRRLADRIADEARDLDTNLTRAARDRDRATPRDRSYVASTRLQEALPERGEFRHALSGRQRKIRSATKNKVISAAPASQHQAVRTMLTDEDPREWSRINRALHNAAGDVQQLPARDRAVVQRLDRAIQSYERRNDRTHRVYVSVELPDTQRDIRGLRDIPMNLRPGTSGTFDQFTITRHNLHETPGHDSDRHLLFEIATNRGMYLGRSDSIEDTTHILPRGLRWEVRSAEYVTYQTPAGGYGERIVLQLKEQ
ncbi:hypothetical protein AWB85_21275 [Mycobacteroides immunogenum]|uniref:ADP ribosyltransferase domain-containing protein n=2 Tax=Mycobacteroides immunogenum TaxID=83262 RepID=A0A179VE58_9MYCO|nr:hypothetical protein AWB85_21275 [Mycobacteroides immunogenum]